MKKNKTILRLLLIIAVFAVADVAFNSAALALPSTYYIDYGAGSDANNGLSTSAPWQNHPYMASWTGSYTHQSGDQFYFRGGVTWPSSCFPIRAGNGGSSGAVDYYGTNSAWFAGSSFTKPIWDCSGNPINTMYAHTMVTLAYPNVMIDSIVLTNLNWSANAYNIGIYTGTSNVILTNVEFRNWYPVGGAATSNIDTLNLTAGSIFKVSHCICDGRPTNSHTAYGAVGLTTEYSTYCYIVQGVLGECQFCQHNILYNIEESIEGAGMHNNVIYQFCLPNVTNICAYNIISNCSWGELIYASLIAVDSTQTTTELIYENLVINNTSPVGPCILLDPEPDQITGGAGTRGVVCLYNNTIQSSVGLGYIRVESRTTSFWASVTNFNLFDVGETNVGLVPDAGMPTICTSNWELIENNAAANAAGYTLANSYRPVSLASPTVAAGTNLTALNLFSADLLGVNLPSTGAWDIGAYQLPPLGIITGGGTGIIEGGGSGIIIGGEP